MKEITIIACSREFLIEIADQEPVLEMKRKIEELLGIPVEAQTLSVSGWELIDGLDMEDYPIVNQGTRIHLDIKPKPHPHHFNLTIKLPSSRNFTVQVDTTDTVRSLREKINIVVQGTVQLPSRMSLYYSGVELEDDFRNLSEYGVRGCGEVVVFFKTRVQVKGSAADAAARSSVLSLVVQTSSCLLNGAMIPVEMKDSGTVCELRQLLLGSKILPEDDYIFIHRQRIMRDNCSLRWHGVQDGDVLYVFKGTVSRGSH